MPLPEESSATTVVIEMEPGWIYVKIAEPKPEPDRIELLLRLTAEQWFNAHPQFVIDKAQAITDHGVMQEIHVWYHFNDHQPATIPVAPPQQPSSLTIEVRNEILRQHSKEHIEGVVEEAMQIWRSYPDGQSTTVVINRRRIAVILDKQANRGAVVPVALIYPAIDDATKSKVQTWLEAPPTRIHVIQIDGSWFVGQRTETQKSSIVDPLGQRTNMTYDTEPPPTE